MNRANLLKISSIISVIFALGHTMGGIKKWSPMGDNNVLKTMSDVHFQVYGASRSYLDFFMGFGWSLSISMLVQAAILWQMSKLEEGDSKIIRPMIAVFIFATLGSMAISGVFLFMIPVLFSLVLLCPLVAAYLIKQ
jgi:hypothetical protein